MGLHFTAIEIGAAFVNLKYPIDGFYRPHKNPIYEYIQAWGRTRHNELSKVIPNSDLRRIVKELRSGEVVNYAPDQDYGRRRSVFSPFFKIPTATVKAPASLAKSGNAEIVPWVTTRTDDYGKYKITIFPPITSIFSCNNEQEDALKLNQFIEARIKENPEQYLWVHRRFKTRPEGEPSLYDF
jgi:KDO2-lipid IV(A) lauroyltransferase